MNDLDLLRAMRADAPEPPGARQAHGRERLRSAIARPGPRRRRPTVILAGGLAAAAALTGVIVIRPAPGAAPPGAAASPAAISPGAAAHGSPDVRLLSATVVLDKAAQAAAAEPPVMPRPHQWVYQKWVKRGVYRSAIEGWTRFDGVLTADVEHGRLVVYRSPGQDANTDVTPQGAARLLRSLPARPRELLAAIYKLTDAQPPGRRGAGNRDARAWSLLVGLLWNAPVGVPPRTHAAAFRAMALIPGIRVNSHLTDGVGRPAIGLTRAGNDGYFLIDPHTYVVAGLRTGNMSITRVAVAVVSKAGQR